MRQGSNILDGGYFNTSILYGTDSGLSAGTRTFYKNFGFAHTQFVGHFSAIRSCHLSRVRSVFLGTSEAHFTSRCPGDNLPIVVGNGNDDIIKRRFDVNLSGGFHHYDTFLSLIFSLLSHYINYLEAFFLLATVFRLPLRVRELFLVR